VGETCNCITIQEFSVAIVSTAGRNKRTEQFHMKSIWRVQARMIQGQRILVKVVEIF
jgi:hypothetical protein